MTTSARDFMDHALRSGALVSGGPVPTGAPTAWATQPFMRGRKAHRWTHATDLGSGSHGYRSACGLHAVSTPRVPLLAPGNLPFCTRCENALMRAMKR